MAVKDVYVPCFMVGADGKRAYEFIKLQGTVFTGPGKFVPEGECCISSRVITSTPPEKLQPRGNAPAPGGP